MPQLALSCMATRVFPLPVWLDHKEQSSRRNVTEDMFRLLLKTLVCAWCQPNEVMYECLHWHWHWTIIQHRWYCHQPSCIVHQNSQIISGTSIFKNPPKKQYRTRTHEFVRNRALTVPRRTNLPDVAVMGLAVCAVRGVLNACSIVPGRADCVPGRAKPLSGRPDWDAGLKCVNQFSLSVKNVFVPLGQCCAF